jgi:hypothetical protein
MDDTFGISNTISRSTALPMPRTQRQGWPMRLVNFIATQDVRQSGFKTEFINRFADLLNTSFLTSRILSEMNAMKAQLEPSVQEHFSRWEVPFDTGDWEYFRAPNRFRQPTTNFPAHPHP